MPYSLLGICIPAPGGPGVLFVNREEAQNRVHVLRSLDTLTLYIFRVWYPLLWHPTSNLLTPGDDTWDSWVT